MFKKCKNIVRLLLVITIILSMCIGLNWTFVQATLAEGLVLDYLISTTFNGTSDFIDKTGDISTIANLAQGSIVVKFKSTSTAIAKTFISASHTTDPASNISFTLNNGTVYFENRENNTYAVQLSAEGSYNDGNWHTAVLTVDNTGTSIYVDSVLNATSDSTAFFSNVAEINNICIGRNVDSSGGEWYYAGDIEFIKIYNRALTGDKVMELSASTSTAFFNDKIIFDNTDGRGYAQYRIPSTVVTGNGTVLIACEARAGDDQSPTDIVLKRSIDGGKTFSDQVILAPGKSQGYAEMNPMLLAENTGSTVHLLWSRWSWGDCKYFIRTSNDDGITWSAQRDITNALDAYKDPSNPYYFSGLAGAGMGPGHGIQLTDGTLVVPIYITKNNWYSSTVASIYSTDGGTTWNAGSKVPHPLGYLRIHENMMVQLSNGDLLSNMRNPASDYRAISKSTGVTGTWSSPYSDYNLVDPVCQGSVQRYDASSILFTNCANRFNRTNMTVKLSYDDCATWSLSKQIYSGTSGYSDIAVGIDKTIYVFYEKPACDRIALARFNKEWMETQ